MSPYYNQCSVVKMIPNSASCSRLPACMCVCVCVSDELSKYSSVQLMESRDMSASRASLSILDDDLSSSCNNDRSHRPSRRDNNDDDDDDDSSQSHVSTFTHTH